MKLFFASAFAFALSVTMALGVDFSQPVLDPNGKPMLNGDVKQGEPLPPPATLGTVSSQALFGSYPDEQNLAAQEKFERGELGIEILHAKGDLPLSAEQIAELKKVIGKAYGPFIVAETWLMLDPNSSVSAPASGQ